MNRGTIYKGESYLLDAESGLIAGVMEHMACFLQTGRPKAARLALILLDRIVQDQETDPTFKEHGQHLADFLEDKLAGIAPIPSRAERQVAKPNPNSWPTPEIPVEAV